MKQVSVALLPKLIAQESLLDCTAVVIDVLRATSVMVTALANAAENIIACGSVDEAVRQSKRYSNSLLCGERGGLPIEGFDLGNSPAEYTKETVGGKTLIVTTTNGTRALAAVNEAAEVITASLLNLNAAVEHVARSKNVLVVCAGTNGEISSEDVLAAGAMAKRLVDLHGFAVEDDQTMIAMSQWKFAGDATQDSLPLSQILARSRGGRNLVKIGYFDDLRRVAEVDKYSLVPVRRRNDPIQLSL